MFQHSGSYFPWKVLSLDALLWVVLFRDTALIPGTVNATALGSILNRKHLKSLKNWQNSHGFLVKFKNPLDKHPDTCCRCFEAFFSEYH
jgi:hypothetical protein